MEQSDKTILTSLQPNFTLIKYWKAFESPKYPPDD